MKSYDEMLREQEQSLTFSQEQQYVLEKILEACSNHQQEITLDLTTDYFANHRRLCCDEQKTLIRNEYERLEQLIHDLVENGRKKLEFTLDEQLLPQNKKQIYETLQSQGWSISHEGWADYGGDIGKYSGYDIKSSMKHIIERR